MSEPCNLPSCKMEEEIRQIHLAVCGDPKHGHRGLVNRVEALEITVANRSWWRDLWAAIAVSVVGVIALFKK